MMVIGAKSDAMIKTTARELESGVSSPPCPRKSSRVLRSHSRGLPSAADRLVEPMHARRHCWQRQTSRSGAERRAQVRSAGECFEHRRLSQIFCDRLELPQGRAALATGSPDRLIEAVIDVIVYQGLLRIHDRALDRLQLLGHLNARPP